VGTGQLLKVGNFQDSGGGALVAEFLKFSVLKSCKNGGNPRNWQFLVFGSTLYTSS
jgi:hypothetical protein